MDVANSCKFTFMETNGEGRDGELVGGGGGEVRLSYSHIQIVLWLSFVSAKRSFEYHSKCLSFVCHTGNLIRLYLKKKKRKMQTEAEFGHFECWCKRTASRREFSRIADDDRQRALVRKDRYDIRLP